MNPEERQSTLDPETWYRITREGKDLVMNMLDIEVPIIAAVNGPAPMSTHNCRYWPMSCLAAEHAEFADLAHFVHGVVPGDSAQVVWPMLLGPNRGRHFLLTGQRIGAHEALALGVVAEVLPADALLPRAWALAQQWVMKPLQTLRYTRIALTQPIKRRMLEELGYGMAMEGLAITAT